MSSWEVISFLSGLGGLGITLILWALDRLGRKMPPRLLWAILILGVTLIVLPVVWVGTAWLRKEATQTTTQATSTLVSCSRTFIDRSQVDPSQKVSFSLGKGGIHFGYTLSELESGAKIPFYLDGPIPFEVRVDGGEFRVRVSVYGGGDAPPIEIDGIQFLVRPPKWDKNYDGNAFEVVNENGDPVFQLICETPYHIVVNGIFPLPEGNLIWANESGVVFNPSRFEVFHLKPIFKYPSSKYLGQRTN